MFNTWERFWLRPASAASLAMFRIAFYSAVLLIYLNLDDRPWAQLSPVFWMPITVFHFLPGFWRSTIFIGWVQTLWKISLAAAAVGILTRIAAVYAAVAGVFLLGLANNFGKINHVDGIVAVILCILCVSRIADDLSLDAVIRPRSATPSEYGWPLKLVRVMFTLVFFAAAIAKLRASGLQWMTADNIRYLLLSHAYTNQPPTNVGLWIAQYRWLCGICAVGTVALELSMPLALFSERLRYPLVIGSLLMQTMIELCMGVSFTPFLAAYLAFLPWERWAAIVLRRREQSATTRGEGQPNSTFGPAPIPGGPRTV
jgi:hypothetical protein